PRAAADRGAGPSRGALVGAHGPRRHERPGPTGGRAPPLSTRLRRAGPHLAYAALCYLPLLATAPGQVVADTKSYLYLDPGRLLRRAWSMWDPHVGLGTVTHQNIGFLWPMGPYYWGLE